MTDPAAQREQVILEVRAIANGDYNRIADYILRREAGLQAECETLAAKYENACAEGVKVAAYHMERADQLQARVNESDGAYDRGYKMGLEDAHRCEMRHAHIDALEAERDALHAETVRMRGLLKRYMDNPSDELDDAYEGIATYKNGSTLKVMLTPKGWLDHEAHGLLKAQRGEVSSE